MASRLSLSKGCRRSSRAQSWSRQERENNLRKSCGLLQLRTTTGRSRPDPRVVSPAASRSQWSRDCRWSSSLPSPPASCSFRHHFFCKLRCPAQINNRQSISQIHACVEKYVLMERGTTDSYQLVSNIPFPVMTICPTYPYKLDRLQFHGVPTKSDIQVRVVYALSAS